MLTFAICALAFAQIAELADYPELARVLRQMEEFDTRYPGFIKDFVETPQAFASKLNQVAASSDADDASAAEIRYPKAKRTSPHGISALVSNGVATGSGTGTGSGSGYPLACTGTSESTRPAGGGYDHMTLPCYKERTQADCTSKYGGSTWNDQKYQCVWITKPDNSPFKDDCEPMELCRSWYWPGRCERGMQCIPPDSDSGGSAAQDSGSAAQDSGS